MLDKDIRPSLLNVIRAEHPDAALFEEFPVCRKGRADVVAVNASLWGYEIKSERDTLNRLPLQIKRYDCIFDYCVVVAAERHLNCAERMIPPHWGIFSARGPATECSIIEIRKPQRNPNRQLDQIIKILWKSEAAKVLRAHGIKVSRTASVSVVWKMIRNLPVSDIEESVRSTLKSRCAPESALS